jgi:hypothetical protein
VLPFQLSYVLLFPLALQLSVGFDFLRHVALVWNFLARGVFQGKVVDFTPNLEGQSPEFISPWGRIAQLYPQALGSSGTSGAPLTVPTNVGP